MKVVKVDEVLKAVSSGLPERPSIGSDGLQQARDKEIRTTNSGQQITQEKNHPNTIYTLFSV